MDGAVEEGAAGQLFGGGLLLRGIVEHDRQRVVPGGILGRVADRGGGFGRLERNRRPIGIRRLIVGMDLGLGLAEKVLGFQLDPPAGHQFPVRRTRARGDGAVTARQAGEAEAGGILAPHQRVVPAVLAEAEQHGRIGDPRTVVGDGDGERGLARRGGDFVGPGDGSGNRNAHPRGAGAAAVLQGLGEDVGEGSGVDAGDPLHGGFVDAGADRPGHGRTSMLLRNRKRPARLPRPPRRGREGAGRGRGWGA